MRSFTILPLGHLLIDANPVVVLGGGPGSIDPGTPFAYVTPPAASGVTLAPAGAKVLVNVAADAPPGVTQIDVIFKAVSFGPNITASFQILVPEGPATTLDFVADPVQS